MKDAILRFLVSKLGGVLTPIIAGVIGLGVSKLAGLSPELASSVDQMAVAAFVVGLIISIINYKTNAVQTNGMKQIQALVNTDQDGVPGPITYTEVRKAIELNQAEKETVVKKRRKTSK